MTYENLCPWLYNRLQCKTGYVTIERTLNLKFRILKVEALYYLIVAVFSCAKARFLVTAQYRVMRSLTLTLDGHVYTVSSMSSSVVCCPSLIE